MGQRISLTAFGSLLKDNYKYVVGAVALGYYAVVRIAQKRAEKRAENFPALFYSEEGEPLMERIYSGSSLGQTIAVVAVALVGTYVVKIAQKRAEKKKPPTPRRYSGGSVGEAGNNLGCGRVSREEEPWCLSPGELEMWYNENIQRGTDAFARDCRSAIDSVVRHVHRNCKILDFDIDKVVKGGSLGKGTMVKDLSDVDLVAFVNKPHLKPIAEIGKEEYKRTLSRIISNITSTLQSVPNVKDIRFNQYLVNFKIKVGRRWIDVDLLPTTKNDLSFQTSYHEMFLSMLEVGHETRQFYSAALVQHQVQFVKEQPGYVKELIRLVKYWAYKSLPEKLQKSYPLELITIYRWKKAGSPGHRLSKTQGLKMVLDVLTNLDSLRVCWQDDDLSETIIKRLNMKRPIVLDPANPTNNVCYMYQWDNNKEVIAAAAARTLQTMRL